MPARARRGVREQVEAASASRGVTILTRRAFFR